MLTAPAVVTWRESGGTQIKRRIRPAWVERGTSRSGIADVIAAYGHATDPAAPDPAGLLRESVEPIEIVIPNLASQPGVVGLLRARAADGCRIRIIIEDPDEQVEAMLGIEAIEVRASPKDRARASPPSRSNGRSELDRCEVRNVKPHNRHAARLFVIPAGRSRVRGSIAEKSSAGAHAGFLELRRARACNAVSSVSTEREP